MKQRELADARDNAHRLATALAIAAANPNEAAGEQARERALEHAKKLVEDLSK